MKNKKLYKKIVKDFNVIFMTIIITTVIIIAFILTK